MPGGVSATHKRLQRVLCRPCNFNTDHATKQRTGLYSGLSSDYASSTAHNTRPTQAAITPPAPRWSVSQRGNTSSTYKIPPPRRTLYRSAQPPYYNKVYKALPCYGSMPDSAAHTADHASPAACDLTPGQPGTLHPAGRSSSQSAAGGAEPLTATAASLFGLSPDSQ